MTQIETMQHGLDFRLEELLYGAQYTKTALDSFAERVDNQIQNRLVSEVIERYVDVLRELEEKSHQLEVSDATRREAQEMALLGNWEMNLDTKVIWWSDTMSTVLEFECGDTCDLETYMERVHPEDKAEVERLTDEMLEGMASPDHRYRLVMDDGRSKWVHVRGVVDHDANGMLRRIYGTMQDITSAKVVEETLWKYNDHLEEMVRDKVDEVLTSQMTTIHALVKLAESRDDDMGEHIIRTAGYCRFLAEKLHELGMCTQEIDSEFIEGITQAGPLHDIGKVGVPDAILLKPGKLTPDEFEIMKTHAEIGYETLASVGAKGDMSTFIKLGMEITRFHHERWDGSGYPQGRKGEEIPVSARIMALADVYDALRSKRVYKRAYPHEESVELISRGRGTHFDPILVDIFLEHQHRFREIFEKNPT